MEAFSLANQYVVFSLLALKTALKQFDILLTKGSNFFKKNQIFSILSKIFFFYFFMQVLEVIFRDFSKILYVIEIGCVQRPREHNFSLFLEFFNCRFRSVGRNWFLLKHEIVITHILSWRCQYVRISSCTYQ